MVYVFGFSIRVVEIGGFELEVSLFYKVVFRVVRVMVEFLN